MSSTERMRKHRARKYLHRALERAQATGVDVVAVLEEAGYSAKAIGDGAHAAHVKARGDGRSVTPIGVTPPEAAR